MLLTHELLYALWEEVPKLMYALLICKSVSELEVKKWQFFTAFNQGQ